MKLTKDAIDNIKARRAAEQLADVNAAIEKETRADWAAYKAAGGADSLDDKDLDLAWNKIAKLPIEYARPQGICCLKVTP